MAGVLLSLLHSILNLDDDTLRLTATVSPISHLEKRYLRLLYKFSPSKSQSAATMPPKFQPPNESHMCPLQYVGRRRCSRRARGHVSRLQSKVDLNGYIAAIQEAPLVIHHRHPPQERCPRRTEAGAAPPGETAARSSVSRAVSLVVPLHWQRWQQP
jgi:hypothetical protein